MRISSLAAVLGLLLISPGVGLANEEMMVAQWDFSEGLEGWSLYRGDSITHLTDDGHLTPNGAVETSGSTDGLSGVESECIDVSQLPSLFKLRVSASTQLTGPTSGPNYARLSVLYYRSSDCSGSAGSLGSDQLSDTQWKTFAKTTLPHMQVNSVVLRIFRKDTPDGGGIRLDDVSIYAERNVKQLWAIGVGEISGNTLSVSEMVFTRGGVFGSALVPSEITRDAMGALEIAFSSCDAADMVFTAAFYTMEMEDVAYPIIRLVPNRAVAPCAEQGFENMPMDDYGWIAGYWWGGPERDGEGFAIDVLDDGVTVVITWYTYMIP